jgi:hypothetical protein
MVATTLYLRDFATGQLLFDPYGYPLLFCASFINNGGFLGFAQAYDAIGWPSSPIGLGAGDVWNNGLTVAIVPGVVPNPNATAQYFGKLTPLYLLGLGGGNLPLTQPISGSLQIWNDGGTAAIA